MNLSPEKQIEQNITLCENIIDILDMMSGAEICEPDIFLKIDELQKDAARMKEKVEGLKILYKQVIL